MNLKTILSFNKVLGAALIGTAAYSLGTSVNFSSSSATPLSNELEAKARAMANKMGVVKEIRFGIDKRKGGCAIGYIDIDEKLEKLLAQHKFDDLINLLHLSEKYQIQPLKNLCTWYLNETLNEDKYEIDFTYIKNIANLASLYNLKYIRQSCHYILLKNEKYRSANVKK